MTMESLLGFKMNLFVCRQLNKCYTWGFSVLKSNAGLDWLSVKWTHGMLPVHIQHLLSVHLCAKSLHPGKVICVNLQTVNVQAVRSMLFLPTSDGLVIEKGCVC